MNCIKSSMKVIMAIAMMNFLRKLFCLSYFSYKLFSMFVIINDKIFKSISIIFQP